MKEKFFDWRSSFALDLRSMALFRIALGICLFLDLTYRCLYLSDFYTDWGVLPRDAAIGQFLGRWDVSFHLMNGLWGVQLVLFSVGVLASIGLTLGFYTRVCAFICWAFVCSMQIRNQVVLHGGDDMFRMLLFWCQFVPLAAEFSLDKYLNGTKNSSNRFVSIGTAGLILQMCYLYFFTALLKWHPVWHTEGSAIYYALNLDQFTSPIGKYLLNFPDVMKLLTFATVSLEFFGPISVLMPFTLFNWRLLVALSFIGFHMGLAATMELGLFPWVCMSGWLAILPSSFWDKWLKFSWENEPIKKLSELLKNKVRLLPPAPRLNYSKFNQGLAAIFFSLIFYWNLSHLAGLKLEKPQWMRMAMTFSHTYQKWSMFAPYPRKDDGWYIVEGDLLNGQKVNLWSQSEDHALSFDKPANVADTYRNTLWRKYLTNIWLSSYKDYRLFFGRYLCRMWNDYHGGEERVNTMHIHYMMEMTPLPGQPMAPIKKETIWRHYCLDKPTDWE